ncbi:hypothetical protein CYMTET_53955 [Cymbomonas tetramitiformis]|uniref:Uncharacterized protein n=1 Tax=Cymbomonas tetramitiformis TaxID=36881 RepID=A0AAE0BH45_9CHLO|nr:hypothetical protein CYMTET_53955 [Cymbomonas tetramitiformis]
MQSRERIGLHSGPVGDAVCRQVAGDRMHQRAATSLLHAARCEHNLVASSLREYEDKAIALILPDHGQVAHRLVRHENGYAHADKANEVSLTREKTCVDKARRELGGAALFDTKRWTQNFETGLSMAWSSQCDTQTKGRTLDVFE